MLRLITILTLAFLLAVFLFAAVARAQDDTTQGPQPSCLMEELRKDLGEVFEQDKFTYDFKVKNVGDAELKIISVRPG